MGTPTSTKTTAAKWASQQATQVTTSQQLMQFAAGQQQQPAPSSMNDIQQDSDPYSIGENDSIQATSSIAEDIATTTTRAQIKFKRLRYTFDQCVKWCCRWVILFSVENLCVSYRHAGLIDLDHTAWAMI